MTKKIGIFYGSSSGHTKKVAEKILTFFGKDKADLFDVRNSGKEDVMKYTFLIFGTSAWGIGDMQDDWESFIGEIAYLDFSGKKIAVFGLGDQLTYPDSFADALGTLYCRLPDKSVIVGGWETDGYKYYYSMAERDGKFVGLVLDEHNQPELSDGRLQKWLKSLKKEFV